MSKPVVVANPRLQTDIDLNPRLRNVNLAWIRVHDCPQRRSRAFPHCLSLVIGQVFYGFVDLNQQRAGQAATRDMSELCN